MTGHKWFGHIILQSHMAFVSQKIVRIVKEQEFPKNYNISAILN